ncbi:MAG: VTT domain-containing protein [Clostridia bacterium]|nr:VTT domain-containing protein [Clostridia bacterium]
MNKGSANSESELNKFGEVLKHTVNILAAVLFGAVAFIFTAYGLAYKSLPFISEHFTLLVYIFAAAFAVLSMAYIALYLCKKQTFYRLIMCALIFADIFAVTFFAICATGIINKINSIQALRDYIAQFGNMAVFLFILFCFLQVVILPVPGSVAVAAGVALFGPLKCAIYSFIGIVTGSIVAFAIGRWVGFKAVKWIVGEDTLNKWLQKLKGKDYLILSIMFLLPMFPDDVLCFVAGLSSMTWPYFLIMITITRLMSSFATAYSLGLIPFNTWWGILIWVLLAAVVIISFWLVWKYSDKIDNFIKTKLKLKR